MRYRIYLERRAIALAFAAVTLATSPAPAAPAPVTLTPATISTGTNEVVRFEHGTLRVREQRDAPDSPIITIGFARLRATRPTAAPPIFFLPGGPGASYLDAFRDHTENAERRLGMFRRYAAVADVIVVDQRGFSQQHTVLTSPAQPPFPLDRPLTEGDIVAATIAYARASIAANPTHELAAYNLLACADDVDELRAALGYAKISLLGGSFGSQWSFAVMRRHPDRVARAVLSGVEPLDAGFDLPSHVFAAMQRIAFDADRAPQLQPYLPPGGVMAALRAVHARLTKAPIEVTVRYPDTIPNPTAPTNSPNAATPPNPTTANPTTRPITLTLGVTDLQSAWAPEDAETWPAFVLALYHGHYEDWAARELASRRSPMFRAVINPLIDAGIGATPARLHQLATDPAIELLGRRGFAPYLAARAAWPVADLGDELRTPIRSAIPVVFVQGDWDTSTPVDNTLAIAPYFTAGRTVIVHRGVHEATSRLLRSAPDAFAALLEFFRTGDTARLPSEATLPVPAFAVPSFPPPRR